MNALFVGYGKMGGALGEAWLSVGLIKNLFAIDPGSPTNVAAEIVEDVGQVPPIKFDIVVLAVKPSIAAQALNTLPAELVGTAIIVSIMAGVTCAQLQSSLLFPAQIVRVMPNTPVLVNRGCSGMYSASLLAEDQRDIVEMLFSAVGYAVWLEEEIQIDKVTAISGSGPAYYHLFSEALADAAIELGLEPDLARKLVAQTIAGAAELQVQAGSDFAKLREVVTSPNGTTAAAIDVFESGRCLRQLGSEAVKAAYQRSVELSKKA